MRLFLSWSGQRSKYVALALRDWLPSVLQAVDPFMSSEDIPKGAQWTARLVAELKVASFAIICVTSDNKNKPWLNFEAGALSHALTDAKVSPFLLGIRSTDIDGPLSIYQMAEANEADTYRLLRSINAQLEQPLPDEKLEKAFNRWWPDLLTNITTIESTQPTHADSQRSTDEVIREVLEVVRNQARLLTALATATRPRQNEHLQPSMGGYQVGQYVTHPRWGEGVVIDVSGSNASTLLTVMFRSAVGQKMLNAQTAPLEKIPKPMQPRAIYGVAEAMRIHEGDDDRDDDERDEDERDNNGRDDEEHDDDQ